MAVSLTTDAFDVAVVRRCGWPLVNAPLEQNERLAIANEEIAGTLFPRVLKAHASYYLTIADTALVAGTEQYRVPARAYGGLRTVSLVTSDGQERVLTYADVADLAQFSTQQGVPSSYYVDGDYIGVRPVPSDTSYTLRVRYVRRPNDLCVLARAGVIADFDLDTPDVGTATVELVSAAVLAVWGMDDDFDTVDLVDIINPGNAYAVIATAGAALEGEESDTLVLESADFSRMRVGDYISLAETSPIVQLPSYLHSAAVRYIAGACLTAHGDREAAQIEFAHAEDAINNAFAVGIPRVESSARPITTRNSPFRIMGRR